MIVVTGAAGFIGSYLVSFLNQKDRENIIIVDDFSFPEKNKNLNGKRIVEQIERENFIEWFSENAEQVTFVYHLGARTNTAEFDEDVLQKLNVDYSKAIWEICAQHEIGLIYASSAATYGLGEHGYNDSEEVMNKLEPLNPYGISKNEFDKWAFDQSKQPPFWVGLKFFNVYGPNEYHKGRMASVILHAHNQIKDTGKMKLFQSHNSDYKDGEQMRDFVYVWDLANVMFWMREKLPANGLYNMGSGKARTFLDLVNATFEAIGKKSDISFIPTPEDIRDKYQYFTEANMNKLKEAGYPHPFHTLEEGVKDYVTKYLSSGTYY
ncbi:MAG: ADP-glyceromanno-heptose 6-epimerase [Flavobacteriales bacterium]|nr:ADP-glyceromanno-heptose 6-epimerase [Flavobacteriales bacterium]